MNSLQLPICARVANEPCPWHHVYGQQNKTISWPSKGPIWHSNIRKLYAKSLESWWTKVAHHKPWTKS